MALKTAFPSAPYILELLETAAEENSTSYFLILDRVADGYFAKATTDKQLYEQFIQVLQDDGHISDPDILATYKLALSLRSSAPRIEAHYQYYHTAVEPSLKEEQDSTCPVWVASNGKQYCSPDLGLSHGDILDEGQVQELPFDRVLGNTSAAASILYADITSPAFSQFHKILVRKAREGKTSYRLRHRSPLERRSQPLLVNGYGVELALKRTDYIVIDDRDEADPKEESSTTEFRLDDEELADLKPLSTSELFGLGLKASSYIMQSDDPFNTLGKVSQDFPKFSTVMAAQDISNEFLAEHTYNRGQIVPAGVNVLWINGMQMIDRQIDPFSLLQIIRNERKLINGVRDLGLSGPEAIKLLSHQEINLVKAQDEPQRFDWRDTIEGGNVIIWMNDIEKDKRYAGWPVSLPILFQRTYPGQLPALRKDIHNLILPIDFSSLDDVELVIRQAQSLVKRKLPIQVGLVPVGSSEAAIEQAKVVYHLKDTYGISAVIAYLTEGLNDGKLVSDGLNFNYALKDKKIRKDKFAGSLEEALKAEVHKNQVDAAQLWVRRLSADAETLPFFMNGVAYSRTEQWFQNVFQRISADLPIVQKGVYEDSITDNTWIPEVFLTNASPRRNALVIPEDEKLLRFFDVNKLYTENKDIFESLPRLSADLSTAKADFAHILLIVDLSSAYGRQLSLDAAYFREANPGNELVILHNPESVPASADLSSSVFAHTKSRNFVPIDSVQDMVSLLNTENHEATAPLLEQAHRYWDTAKPILRTLGLRPGEHAILINGRLVGPLGGAEFGLEDYAQLLSYERAKRIGPAYRAMENLGLSEKIVDPLSSSKVSSIIVMASLSDMPDGIFEQPSTIRINIFDSWKSEHTAIEVGTGATAGLHITATVDPASEKAQRWIPILKALSELDGVHLKLFLNPKERLQELPVKRFYRFVLESQPIFEDDGSLRTLGATFTGVPQEALLTLGLDEPAPWLVAAKDSIYDLDNIKLSSIKADVNALYELEHILIEGHSREPGGEAPRGAQLVLGTQKDPHFADTIIMANLGYFQFKANPGFYKIGTQEGRSSEIFQFDSVGAQGWSPVPGDEVTDACLMTFQGLTLYPRLSRKPGKEKWDVLGEKPDELDVVSRGLKFAQSVFGGKPKDVIGKQKQADINIFSVASGHLYERMLNIMMVSVMKHTKHSVKFWFIEQFLSPSFKDFIPYLAAEYGFEYEMVTYKWPHWLRSQTEKQREIWGYKILFLDVLFPLSLDKVIFVDADQIVRTDMIELVNHELKGAPYGFTPMCDSRTEMEGFRFWKQGYWKSFLKGLPYHISALYVVDLHRFRQMAAGDRLRQQYHQLSADPNSLSNLDQDLPNHMQMALPIHSLPQEWLWCETWCSDESQAQAKTIDLCNNPQTKEPKLDRARRQVPEWTIYDDEIAAVDQRRKESSAGNDGATSTTTILSTGTTTILVKERTPEAKNLEDRKHEEL